MLGHLATAAALAVAASAQIENYQEWVEHASPASSEQYTQSANGWISPEYTWLFEYPLPIPEVAVPIITQNFDGTNIEFYNATIEKFTSQIYPNLGPTHLVGYNGTSPGPSYIIQNGTQSVHRYINNGNTGASVHVHGSHARAVWDGWAADMIQPGQFKDYYYPNDQTARTLWYHDHAEEHTAQDAYFGQAGSYLLRSPEEDLLGLPTGKYDLPMILIDKIYGADGDLVNPENETMNFYGDVMHVNGRPWPYFEVEPRKYRLRTLSCCLSRPLLLQLMNDVTGLNETFNVIASDAGLFDAPVLTDSLYLAMGERYDIVIDFAQYANTNLTMTNNLNWGDIPQYAQTDKIMRFVVGGEVTDWTNNNLPAALAPINWPEPRATIDHVFAFDHNGENWTINGVDYGDAAARTLAHPPQGSVETWELRYESGPGFHPVHIHLIQFQIISRTGGRGMLEPYETAGLKDVVLVAPGEVVTVTAYFGPWNGLYMFHCHNLVHEDHYMMDVFNVSANPIIAELGFGSSLGFDDPMNTPYSGQDNNYTQFTNEYVIDTLLPDLYNSDAYKNEPAISAALSSYYLTHTYGEASTYSTSATYAAYGAYPTNEAAASWAGAPAAEGAKPTGAMSDMRVMPSSYSAGAPFTFTDSIPTQVTAMSIAVMQATNTAIVETIHFGRPSFPSGSYGPPAGFSHPTGPPAQVAAPTVAAEAAPVASTPVVAPAAPATTAAPAPAPSPPTQEQWSAPAFSAPAWSAPAHSWGPPAAPSEAPTPAPAPAPAPAPSQAPPAAPAPPAEQPQAPPAAFTHPEAPAAPAWTPPAAAAPAPPAAPAAPAWSAPVPAAAPAAPQNHPAAPGFFPGSNSAPQAAAPQAAPASGPPSFGGGAPSWGGHHKREAKPWKA